MDMAVNCPTGAPFWLTNDTLYPLSNWLRPSVLPICVAPGVPKARPAVPQLNVTLLLIEPLVQLILIGLVSAALTFCKLPSPLNLRVPVATWPSISVPLDDVISLAGCTYISTAHVLFCSLANATLRLC